MLIISWCFFHSFVISSIWRDSPRWRGVCKVVVYSVWTILSIHFNWVVLHVDVVNAFSTIFRKPSFKNFSSQEVNCFNFSPLFGPFMPNTFPFSLATIPFWWICQSSILWRAWVKTICSLKNFFCTSPFLCIAMFSGGSSLLYFPFPCGWYSHHWPNLYFSSCFWAFCFLVGFCKAHGLAS